MNIINSLIRRLKKFEKTKICFITYYGYKPFNEDSKITFGGNEVLYYLMAKELGKDSGFNVNFIVEDDINSHEKEKIDNVTLYKTSRNDYSEIEESKKLQDIKKLYNSLAGQLSELVKLPYHDFFRLWKLFEKINSDIYIQGSAGYETGIIALLCKIFNKKFIFYVGHDIDINGEFAQKNGVLGKIFEWGLLNADIIWCSSTRHQKLLKNTYNLPSTYIPYWYPIQGSVLSLNERKHILWVARVEKWKHPEIFLDLAKNFKNEKFVLIGSFSHNEPEFFDEIEKISKSLPNVQLIKNVPLSEIDGYFQNAKAFIETSDYKNMHTSHLQAASAGTPCLSFFGDPNGTFEKYNWGIFAENNFEKLSDDLKKILDNQDTWTNLSKHAISYADQNHNIVKKAEEFKKILHDLKHNA